MREIVGDLFLQKCDAICITTNGMCKQRSDGKLVAVMGAGVAKQAADRFHNLALDFAKLIMKNGHCVQIIHCPVTTDKVSTKVVSFPTKWHWKEQSTIAQVKQSAEELVVLVNKQDWTNIVLPRPGCGLGGLNWYNQVKPILQKILDDRFAIITPK